MTDLDTNCVTGVFLTNKVMSNYQHCIYKIDQFYSEENRINF